MNDMGIKTSLVLLALGLATGFGMAAANSGTLGTSVVQWVTDAKAVTAALALAVLLAARLLKAAGAFRPRTTAYVTLLALFLVFWAMVGSTVFCGTVHDFRTEQDAAMETGRTAE
jgi:hypothetical protein